MFFRPSKFRHTFGFPAKKEECYEGVKVTQSAHDSHFCAVNPLFLAIINESMGGGAFAVLNLQNTGRIDFNVAKVCGHKGPINDLKWSPHDDYLIASASDDNTIKTWKIPRRGLSVNLNQSANDLKGHDKKVTYVEWHPIAEYILLSAGADLTCLIWNVQKELCLNAITLHPDMIYSISWNYDGSLFATTCKDKILRVIDPRTGLIIAKGEGHGGNKTSKVIYLKGDQLLTTGFSKNSERQVALWNVNDLSKPIKIDDLDNSCGTIIPYYDSDLNIIYLAGKGDSNIRYAEIIDQMPHIYFLSFFQSSIPQRGLGWMPKRGLDLKKCEIARFYKLHSLKDICEPISMIVPRKSELFQSDLYPLTMGPKAAMSAEEWFQGENKEPIMIELKNYPSSSSVVHKSNLTHRNTICYRSQNPNDIQHISRRRDKNNNIENANNELIKPNSIKPNSSGDTLESTFTKISASNSNVTEEDLDKKLTNSFSPISNISRSRSFQHVFEPSEQRYLLVTGENSGYFIGNDSKSYDVSNTSLQKVKHVRRRRKQNMKKADFNSPSSNDEGEYLSDSYKFNHKIIDDKKIMTNGNGQEYLKQGFINNNEMLANNYKKNVDDNLNTNNTYLDLKENEIMYDDNKKQTEIIEKHEPILLPKNKFIQSLAFIDDFDNEFDRDYIKKEEIHNNLITNNSKIVLSDETLEDNNNFNIKLEKEIRKIHNCKAEESSEKEIIIQSIMNDFSFLEDNALKKPDIEEMQLRELKNKIRTEAKQTSKLNDTRKNNTYNNLSSQKNQISPENMNNNTVKLSNLASFLPENVNLTEKKSTRLSPIINSNVLNQQSPKSTWESNKNGEYKSEPATKNKNGEHESELATKNKNGEHESELATKNKNGEHESELATKNKNGEHESEPGTNNKNGEYESEPATKNKNGEHKIEPATKNENFQNRLHGISSEVIVHNVVLLSPQSPLNYDESVFDNVQPNKGFIIDCISMDAPDDAVITPSSLRASMNSRRRKALPNFSNKNKSLDSNNNFNTSNLNDNKNLNIDTNSIDIDTNNKSPKIVPTARRSASVRVNSLKERIKTWDQQTHSSNLLKGMDISSARLNCKNITSSTDDEILQYLQNNNSSHSVKSLKFYGNVSNKNDTLENNNNENQNSMKQKNLGKDILINSVAEKKEYYEVLKKNGSKIVNLNKSTDEKHTTYPNNNRDLYKNKSNNNNILPIENSEKNILLRSCSSPYYTTPHTKINLSTNSPVLKTPGKSLSQIVNSNFKITDDNDLNIDVKNKQNPKIDSLTNQRLLKNQFILISTNQQNTENIDNNSMNKDSIKTNFTELNNKQNNSTEFNVSETNRSEMKNINSPNSANNLYKKNFRSLHESRNDYSVKLRNANYNASIDGNKCKSVSLSHTELLQEYGKQSEEIKRLNYLLEQRDDKIKKLELELNRRNKNL